MPEATQRIVPATSAPAMPAFPASVFHLGAGMASAESKDAAAPPPVAAAAPVDTPAPAAPVRKVDLAIAYVKQYGEASRAELATAMGLESDSHVKSFLKTPLADGRLHAEGDRYTIGTGQPLPRPRRARNTTKKASPRSRRSTMRPAAPAAAAPAPAAHKTSPAAVAQILVGGISISVRKDGGVSISANGSAVDLTPDQANIMRAFEVLLTSARGAVA
ncbi:hypothetical protein [Cupriavidus taiwanensis]|uniref:hypothetical protein n=1 Tax=Cupriavidus taiwanensis TaxID=164546 RepID=UPI0039C3D438